MRRRAPAIATGGSGKINVTPLIDVVMVLIVFYLMVGKMASDQRADLPLPESRAGAELRDEDAIVIEVRAGGSEPRVSLDGADVSLEALGGALRAAMAAAPDHPIRIRADRRLAYGAVEPAIDAARRAGASSIRLAAERAAP
ncbi:MAG: biopolymer transporter ExbD [Phycisphaerales bacterium]|nr:biopolymer transporter ExbD [Phycisphaerales bacterium]